MEGKNPFIKHSELIEEKALQCLDKDIPPTPDFLLEVYRNENQLRKMYSDVDSIIDGFRSCGHKIQSLQYHLDNYFLWEEKYVKNFKKALKCIPLENLTMGGVTPNLIFEYESFLFQFKACLDMFSRAVGRLFKQKPSNISKLKNALKNHNSNDKAKKMLGLISKNEGWLREFNSDQNFRSDRDKVAHYNIVNLGNLNVNKRNDEFRIIINLEKENMTLKEYLEKRLKNLKLFLQETITIIRE